MLMPLRRYVDFQGRSRRKEYWLFTLFYILGSIVLLTLDALLGGGGVGAVLYGLFVLALFIPSIAVLIRRLHDTDRSGWWILITFLPVVGGLVLLVFMVLEGTPGANKYGPSPKPEHAAAVFA